MAFTRSPLILCAEYWNKHYSPYVAPPNLDVKDEEVRENNLRRFQQDMRFALHLKCEGYVIVKLFNQDPEKLGTAIKEVIDSHFNFLGQILIEIPLVDPIALSSIYCKDVELDEDGEVLYVNEQWSIWKRLHAATGYSSKVQVRIDDS